MPPPPDHPVPDQPDGASDDVAPMDGMTDEDGDRDGYEPL